MKTLFTVLTLAILVFASCQVCLADIPVSCEFPQVYGEWTFQKTKRIYNKNVIYNECSIDQPGLPIHPSGIDTFVVQLAVPDRALLKKNGKITKVGHWTLMWNQAMEIRLDGMKYFAFFNYTLDADGSAISHCDRVFVGTFHDNSIGAEHWGCFTGMRTKAPHAAVRYEMKRAAAEALVESKSAKKEEGKLFESGQYAKYDSFGEYVKTLNVVQNKWTAGMNERFNRVSISKLQNMGNRDKKVNSKEFIEKQMKRDKTGTIRLYNGRTDSYETVNEDQLRMSLPKEFSWTNKNGRNFVTPVRNQFWCGSCYAFGTSVMISDRLRVLSNLTRTEIYSPQAIVDCSPYSQGCLGGCSFSSSKYAQDYGLVQDACDPVNEESGVAQSCNITQCPRYLQRQKIHVSNYYNVGGYYGASNELNMMHDIYHNGPHVAGFMVYVDFFYYTSGVYSHVPEETVSSVSSKSNLPPFYYINHVLTIVGWGEENGTKYWLAKNSWGEEWGNAGYVKVLKGVNECGIESDAEAAIPSLCTNYSC